MHLYWLYGGEWRQPVTNKNISLASECTEVGGEFAEYKYSFESTKKSAKFKFFTRSLLVNYQNTLCGEVSYFSTAKKISVAYFM